MPSVRALVRHERYEGCLCNTGDVSTTSTATLSTPGAAAGPSRSDNYKWIALSNTTLAVLLATLDASITIIAMPDIFRGIKLNPLQSGNSFYLLWMVLGYLIVSSVLIVSPRPARRYVRPGQDLQPRLRDLHGGVTDADDRLDDGARRRHLPGGVPVVPRGRRCLPARQLRRDPDGRVPRQPARNGARHQQHRRRQRHVRRTRARRHPRPDQLAGGVPDLGPRRPVRDRLGLPQTARAEHAPARFRNRLGRQHQLCRRADPDHGLDHLRDPPLRTRFDGLDQPTGSDPARARSTVS